MDKVELAFREPESLYRAYMPFVEGGGLFVAADKPLAMGATIEVQLVLPDEQNYVFSSKVVWTALPDVVSENHIPGYAIQIFGDQAEEIRELIETLTNKFHEDELPTDVL